MMALPSEEALTHSLSLARSARQFTGPLCSFIDAIVLRLWTECATRANVALLPAGDDPRAIAGTEQARHPVRVRVVDSVEQPARLRREGANLTVVPTEIIDPPSGMNARRGIHVGHPNAQQLARLVDVPHLARPWSRTWRKPRCSRGEGHVVDLPRASG